MPFDYGTLDEGDREFVEAAEGRIENRVKRTVEDIIAVGQELIAVKERLKHGEFGKWLKARFGWTRMTAHRLMNVAERFGEMSQNVTFEPSAAYLLAAPSTPDEAREEAVERAKKGAVIDLATAREIVATHKPVIDRSPWPFGDAIDKLREAVERVQDRWPKEGLDVLPEILRTIAHEIEITLGDGLDEL